MGPRALRCIGLFVALALLPASGAQDAQEPVARTDVHHTGQDIRIHGTGALRTAPWNEAWNNSMAICAIMRNENGTDVVEWLQYHRWLGVDKVLLTDHLGENRASVQPFIDAGFVEYQEADTESRQLIVYNECIERHGGHFNWMAFIDADEYIDLRTRRLDLKQFLDRYKNVPALAMSWIMHGPNGQQTRPDSGGALRTYTACNPVPRSAIKVIANTFHLIRTSSSPHNFWYRGFGSAVSEVFHPIGFRCYSRHGPCLGTPHHAIYEAHLRSVRHVALRHYFTRSMEDYARKMERPTADGSRKRNMEDLSSMSMGIHNQVHDPICLEMAQFADECCSGAANDPAPATLRAHDSHEGSPYESWRNPATD